MFSSLSIFKFSHVDWSKLWTLIVIWLKWKKYNQLRDPGPSWPSCLLLPAYPGTVTMEINTPLPILWYKSFDFSPFQLYEDAIEMQMYFIRVRDDLCKHGEILLSPALSFTDRHLQAIVEVGSFNHFICLCIIDFGKRFISKEFNPGY